MTFTRTPRPCRRCWRIFRQQGVNEIYCLGDIIGYGPNPCECLDQVMQSLCRHDPGQSRSGGAVRPGRFQSGGAAGGVLDARTTGAARRRSRDVTDARWDFLGELPRSYSEGEFLYVHGSPREPTNEYVFPEDVYNQRKMDALFDRIERYCFQGHTHIPGVFTASGEFITPDECDYAYRLTGEKAMFNVGSVGQPRDGDPRACYVIVHLDDEPRVEFRRVEYPLEMTIQKIYKIPSLDNMLGDRLRSGR